MTGAAQTLVTLWRENEPVCKPLSTVLVMAQSGDMPGVGEYKINHGYPVLNAGQALAAMRSKSGIEGQKGN